MTRNHYEIHQEDFEADQAFLRSQALEEDQQLVHIFYGKRFIGGALDGCTVEADIPNTNFDMAERLLEEEATGEILTDLTGNRYQVVDVEVV